MKLIKSLEISKYFFLVLCILFVFISCSKNKNDKIEDDKILENILTKNVDFSLIDFNSIPSNPKFLSCFSEDGFHFLSFPDGGVYRDLFSEEMEIYVPYYGEKEKYNEYDIRIVNSYIHNEQEKFDELLILPKLEKLFGKYEYEQLYISSFNDNTLANNDINSKLPMWNLSDRKVYLYGSNVDCNNNSGSFSDVSIIIKMK